MSIIKAFGVSLLATLLAIIAYVILNIAGWQVEISDVSHYVYIGVLLIGWDLYFDLKSKR